MRAIAFILSASLLSACGGSAVQTITSQSNGQTPTNITPTASSGFAKASDNIQDVKPGTKFTLSAREISIFNDNLTVDPFDRTKLSGTLISPTELELELDGKTYTLTYNAPNDRFEGQDGSREISVLLSPQNQYAGMATVTLAEASRFATQASIFTGVIGYSTNPARLPSQARYEGSAVLSAIPEIGASDLAIGTVSMNANFTNGTISGNIALRDPIGDTTGPVDLGNMNIPFDHPYRSGPIAPPTFTTPGASIPTGGVISANTFTAALGISTTDLIEAGLYGDPNLTLEGGFYGPSGENAVGIATGSGRTVSTTGTQDVLLNLSINTSRQ